MRRPIGWILVIVGGVVVVSGAVNAVLELGAIYTRVSEDPLSEPAVSEARRGSRMLWSAGYGAVGVLALGVGLVSVRRGRRGRGSQE
ncbi:MAG TPA: hypothetical protein ENK11_00185 [Phycisphaerales bacterium]|nr:hypothetical protein [Phycisphaerales bacterium]